MALPDGSPLSSRTERFCTLQLASTTCSNPSAKKISIGDIEYDRDDGNESSFSAWQGRYLCLRSTYRGTTAREVGEAAAVRYLPPPTPGLEVQR